MANQIHHGSAGLIWGLRPVELDELMITGMRRVDSLSNFASGDKDQARLRKACEDFEAIFLHEILKALRRTVPAGNSQQEALYRSLLDEQLARTCASRGLGLADLLYSTLVHDDTMEAAQSSPGKGAKDFHEKTDD
jgi:flagellar protein FlgJ